MIDPKLEGKTVLISGANNPLGIGAATAQAFAAVGANVVLHYYRSVQSRPAPSVPNDPGPELYALQQTYDAEPVLADVREAGVAAAATEMDFLTETDVGALFDFAEREVGPVDIVINNAAYCLPDTLIPWTVDSIEGPAETLTDESFDRHFSVNARTPARIMSEFARRIVERAVEWGRIINISTDAAECFPTEVSYGASKLALESLTRSAAREFGPYGITVNVVSPGPIQTGWITKTIEESAAANTPLGRIGRADDVADVIVFLASEQGRWVTGQRIHVGGGHRM